MVDPITSSIGLPVSSASVVVLNMAELLGMAGESRADGTRQGRCARGGPRAREVVGPPFGDARRAGRAGKGAPPGRAGSGRAGKTQRRVFRAVVPGAVVLHPVGRARRVRVS
ncbi:hypothetical protein GCM10012285_32530 [Streptomyces kronopolitis]|uniref:Uncharacterized protein n=1 Tax=Streptomyces kronopolitis TaxID=1612435 RepID=A0ABQ2JGK7_9ACTN|nr:hypothetical protein GCM10012285_32530 [Streptomyces kronopolitis]